MEAEAQHSWPFPPSVHLSQCSLSGADLVDHPEWDTDDGGESQQPAQEVAPPRVHIHVVVPQRGVLDDGEQESALEMTEEHTTMLH